jgi:2-oxoglutarate dehydrogenase E1 component
MKSLTFPTHANSDVIETAYRTWLENPESIDPTWRAFFQGFALGADGQTGVTAARIGRSAAAAGVQILDSAKQAQVLRLINAYRAHGHLQAHLDPLGDPPPPFPTLAIEHFNLAQADLDQTFNVGQYRRGGQMKLSALIAALQQT